MPSKTVHCSALKLLAAAAIGLLIPTTAHQVAVALTAFVPVLWLSQYHRGWAYASSGAYYCGRDLAGDSHRRPIQRLMADRIGDLGWSGSATGIAMVSVSTANAEKRALVWAGCDAPHNRPAARNHQRGVSALRSRLPFSRNEDRRPPRVCPASWRGALATPNGPADCRRSGAGRECPQRAEPAAQARLGRSRHDC